jgi:hypothetical protein
VAFHHIHTGSAQFDIYTVVQIRPLVRTKFQMHIPSRAREPEYVSDNDDSIISTQLTRIVCITQTWFAWRQRHVDGSYTTILCVEMTTIKHEDNVNKSHNLLDRDVNLDHPVNWSHSTIRVAISHVILLLSFE